MQLHKKNHILLLLEHTAVVKNNELWNGSQDLMKKNQTNQKTKKQTPCTEKLQASNFTESNTKRASLYSSASSKSFSLS